MDERLTKLSYNLSSGALENLECCAREQVYVQIPREGVGVPGTQKTMIPLE